jgi:organic hydroperoxide reductase OsmC/OhrA
MASKHEARLSWRRSTPTFTSDTYSRDHVVTFGGGSSLPSSAAPEYRGTAALANPEEMLVAALSSCHMLTFFAIAARDGFVVDSYDDAAEGVLDKNADGRLAVTRVVLRPRIVFGGETQPDAARIAKMHQAAHRGCFIANSVKTEVVVEGHDG